MPAGSIEKLSMMGAGAVGLLWTAGTHHTAEVYERCEAWLDRPLYVLRVGGHKQTALEWLADARNALAEVPDAVLLEGRIVVAAGNEPNIEGWAEDAAGYGRFYRAILEADLSVPVLFACPSAGMAGWWEYLLASSKAVRMVAQGGICNLYGPNVGLVDRFVERLGGVPLYVGEVNSLPDVRGEERRAFLRDAFAQLARAGVVAALVFIAGGASGGAWDERYIVTAAEVAGLGTEAAAASTDGVTDGPQREPGRTGTSAPTGTGVGTGVMMRVGVTTKGEVKVEDQVRKRAEGWAFVFGPVAGQRGVRPSLVAGIIAVESGGNVDAESPMNVVGGRPIGRAQGLMQVLPGHFGDAVTVDGDGEVSLADGRWMRQPLNNVTRGAGVLRDGLDRFGGSEVSAIAAYFGAVDAQGNPTTEQDATGTPGTRYVELVQGAADYFRWLDAIPWERFDALSALDVDEGACQYGATWPEVASNLLGVCNDALAAGREVAAAARQAVWLWGAR